MIPGREYDAGNNFEKVLKERLNTQNFIHRKEKMGNLEDKISTIDNHKVSEIIPWEDYQKLYDYGDA